MSNEVSIFTAKSFQEAELFAQKLAQSDMVPQSYQNKPANILIAFDIATQTRNSLLTVMQNLHIINKRPSWSSAWCTSAIMSCGLYKGGIRHETVDKGPKTVIWTKTSKKWNDSRRQFDITKVEQTTELENDVWRRVKMTDAATGEEVFGEWASYEMAVKNGWWDRDDSKWQSMPDLMLTYRANAFFARTHCPHVLFGMQTWEEAQDIPAPVIEINPQNRSAAPVKHTIDAKPPPPKPSPLDLVAEAFRQIRDCGNLQCVTGILSENSGLFAEFQKENPERYAAMWKKIEAIQETFAAAEKGNQ